MLDRICGTLYSGGVSSCHHRPPSGELLSGIRLCVCKAGKLPRLTATAAAFVWLAAASAVRRWAARVALAMRKSSTHDVSMTYWNRLHTALAAYWTATAAPNEQTRRSAIVVLSGGYEALRLSLRIPAATIGAP